MTENTPRQSAKIYAFPVGGRAGLAIQREGAQALPKAAQVATAVVGGSWYHDEAIQQDAEQARKR
jgi:hypothetical protein